MNGNLSRLQKIGIEIIDRLLPRVPLAEDAVSVLKILAQRKKHRDGLSEKTRTVSPKR